MSPNTIALITGLATVYAAGAVIIGRSDVEVEGDSDAEKAAVLVIAWALSPLWMTFLGATALTLKVTTAVRNWREGQKGAAPRGRQ